MGVALALKLGTIDRISNIFATLGWFKQRRRQSTEELNALTRNNDQKQLLQPFLVVVVIVQLINQFLQPFLVNQILQPVFVNQILQPVLVNLTLQPIPDMNHILQLVHQSAAANCHIKSKSLSQLFPLRVLQTQ